MKAIRIETTGGPDVMQLADVELGKPKAGEVRIRHTAIGLNYIDTYHRSGLYPIALPGGIGLEAAGVIEALGDGVKGFKLGNRVAYGTGTPGAYAEQRNYPVNRLVKLPKAISDETAAGMMLKGMTVRYLLRATYKVKRGETILLHAAAGGVGQILSQWAKALGAKVIGTVGSAEKMAAAREHGCAHVINSSKENVVERVRELTNGDGMPVVIEATGAVAAIEQTIDLVAAGGRIAVVGLVRKGVPVSFPGLDFTRKEVTILGSRASTNCFPESLSLIAEGKIHYPKIGSRHALKDAPEIFATLAENPAALHKAVFVHES